MKNDEQAPEIQDENPQENVAETSTTQEAPQVDTVEEAQEPVETALEDGETIDDSPEIPDTVEAEEVDSSDTDEPQASIDPSEPTSESEAQTPDPSSEPEAPAISVSAQQSESIKAEAQAKKEAQAEVEAEVKKFQASAVYYRAIPPGHRVPSTDIELQNLAKEAGLHQLIDGVWAIKELNVPGGGTIQAIVKA